MKKTVSTERLIKTFQEAIRRTNGLYQGIYENKHPAEHSASIGTIMMVLGLLLEPLGIKVVSLEHGKLIQRVWSVDNRAKYNETHPIPPLVGKSVSKKTQSKPVRMVPRRQTLGEELEMLRRQAARACTCDGGNTNGCSACVAERTLRSLGKPGSKP